VWKIGGPRSDVSESAAEFLQQPILTCRAVGTTVVPKDHQRFPH
jgi:3-aminobutyryl-CoA ammonia-lyase